MRYLQSAVFGAALVSISAATPVNAQAPSGPGVFGFYDVTSGTFRPVTLQAMPAGTGVEPRAEVSRSGKIRFRITITVKNGSDPSVLPFCQGSFGHQGALHSYSESMSVTGTRAANTAECIIVINYFWPHANNASPVTLSIFTTIGSPSHSQSQSLPPIPLPNNGAVTPVFVNIVL